MTCPAGSRYPLVILASPVSQPFSFRHSASSSGPAPLWMAPSTPPPPSSERFAALTMASTARVVMSVWMISIVSFMRSALSRQPAQQREVDGIHLVVVPLGGFQELGNGCESRVVHDEPERFQPHGPLA